MFEGLQAEQLPAAIEAMLFVTDEPVSAITLAQMLEVETSEAQEALLKLQQRLEEGGGGVQLYEVSGGWRLYTHPAYHELLEQYVLSWDTRKLSAAALETLAIVAYMQPVTRAQISAVRGVTSDSPLNTLVERGYVRETGTADAPGNPVLYATTRTFLEKYGLSSVKQLPDLEDFVPDEKTAQLIRERLGAPTSAAVAAAMGEKGALDAQAEGALGDEATAETDTAASLFAAAIDSEGGQGISLGMPRTNEASESIPDERDLPDADRLVAEATSRILGVVDKIDFDKLTFNTDDE